MVQRDDVTSSHTGLRPVACVALACVLALLGALALRLGHAPLPAKAHGTRHAAPSLPGLYLRGVDGSVATDPQISAGTHQYWQVGMEAGPEASDAVGMQTSITTRLPEALAPSTTDYFWVGSFLADGSFVQIGYYVPWYAQDAAGWFYCAFTADQMKGPCVDGPLGSAGSDGQTHTYTLEAGSTANGLAPSVVWTARVDGASVGQFAWTSGTTGPNSPTIYAESSGFEPHPATSQVGPVDFPGLVQTRSEPGAAFSTALHMRPVYTAGDVCPPYGASADGAGGALLGSGLACPSDNAWLW